MVDACTSTNSLHCKIYKIQSAVQDMDYKNELDLLHAVVTLPSRDGNGTEAWFCFLDDRTGEVIKKVYLPTWKTISDSYTSCSAKFDVTFS